MNENIFTSVHFMMVFWSYLALCKILFHQSKEPPLQLRLVPISALLVTHDNCGVGATQSLHSGHKGFKGLQKIKVTLSSTNSNP